VVTLRVRQRYLADHGVEQLGTLQGSSGDQHAAQAAADDAQVARRPEAGGDQVFPDRDEIIAGGLARCLERRGMARTKPGQLSVERTHVLLRGRPESAHGVLPAQC
jgi:hypothetical protein